MEYKEWKSLHKEQVEVDGLVKQTLDFDWYAAAVTLFWESLAVDLFRSFGYEDMLERHKVATSWSISWFVDYFTVIWTKTFKIYIMLFWWRLLGNCSLR